MKKNITLLCFVFLISLFSFSTQAQRRKMNMADYEKRKMEYIRKGRIDPEEAAKYFPLYNDPSKKKFELTTTQG